MTSFCADVDDEVCPIPEAFLAKLYVASEDSLMGLLDNVEPEIKAALAFFCYRRAHLQAVGLAVAASCEESELVSIGGRAGTALFARSRKGMDFLRPIPAHSFKRKITPPAGFACSQPFDQEVE
jgi:hypothetical protein